ISFIFIPLQNLGNISGTTLSNQVEGVFTTTSIKQIQVTANSVNFRTGASSNHRIITTYSKNTVLDVVGMIGNYYVVKNSKDTVGCIYSSYVKPYTPPPTSSDDNFTAMQTEMLGYINAERTANGVAPLTLTKTLSNGAYLKSKDMAVNNYFSHTSPTYGTPFDMMKSLGISYSAAGENIALNTSIKGAHDAFMNSSGHRANILNTGFANIGLGIYQKDNYIYITQWFTN
ncbi:MAG: CAP domain-containing protein, partial [Lutispora sp.]|nr:CAP domain-containing protein [Lutispora sp.]